MLNKKNTRCDSDDFYYVVFVDRLYIIFYIIRKLER